MSIRANKSGSEPIPGYTLKKRLGAGGYGEVWLADAPGGLQKAVKLIYGTVDQSHASSELRSLQRVRQVHHPFLLSIERIEIIDSQVIIVTELAENSLLERFEQCRRKGAPGIDRAQLLDFLRDAADALDFLSQKHGLQHLDVKPGNLLIIADRIKVADFGLIKDLHDQNQSLVSGLTPTYSAPEIFDGRPDYRSDQYSLAIVYMEMLTGQVPFNGKSTGELARQHLTQAPNLESLPPADRTVVARALAKNPLDRYASCRLFVEQLLKTRGAVLPAQSFQLDDAPPATHADSTSLDNRKTSTASTFREHQALQPALDVHSLQKHWTNPRSMFIGLGGLGGLAVHHLRRIAQRDCDNRFDTDDHAWAVIDTDAAALNALTNPTEELSIPAKYAFELRIFRPNEYRHAPSDLFAPLSRRWLYNIPRSLKTEGVRPLAILSLLDHYAPLRKRLMSSLNELVRQHQQDADCQEPLRIYVMTSLHGGTGSGLFAEMGLLIRRILGELAFSNYRLCGLASAATTTNNATANLHSAAGIATLSELTYLMDRERLTTPLHFGDNPLSVSSSQPFDWVTLVDGGLHGNRADLERATRELAQVAWIDSQTPTGASLSESRIAQARRADRPNGWLRAAASVPISVAGNVTAARLARWCCEQTLLHTLQYIAGPRGVSSLATHSKHSQTLVGATVSGDFPLTPQANEDFITRLMKELAIPVASALSAVDTAEARQALLAAWLKRISNTPDHARACRAQDRETWKREIGRIVKMRVYNWKQVEQIQLNAVEMMVNFYEQESQPLADLLCRSKFMLGSIGDIQKAITVYLKSFSEDCLRSVQEFQQEGRKLARRISSWCDSINAEKALNEAAWDVNLSGLPSKLQLLASRVNAVLESTLQRMAIQQVGLEKGLAPDNDQQGATGDDYSTLNLKYMLSLSSELVTRLALELDISEDELNGIDHTEEGAVSFKQIAEFSPSITQSGSQLYRFLIAPLEQEKVVEQALTREKLTENTTLIGSRRSLEATLLCEANDLKLNQLVGSMWRPSQPTLQLAERLRTRIDVDWYPAERLLEALVSEHSEPSHHESAAPVGLPSLNPGTLALPAQPSPS